MYCILLLFHTLIVLIYLLINLPILVNIINVITLCLTKKDPFNEYYFLIYLLFRVLIYILILFTLLILVLISITTILMYLINPYILWLTYPITVVLLCN